MAAKNSLVRTSILTLGIAWGVVAFLMGVAGSFTLNSIDLAESLLLLLCGFLAVLPIAITAIWKPKLSATLLAACFLIVECIALAKGGWPGAVVVSRKLALPNIVLACGYAYLVSIRARAERSI